MVYGDKYGKESIRNWPDTENLSSKNEWFLKFEEDDVAKPANDCQFSGSEGELKRKNGRPRKRLFETEGENVNETKKQQKVEPTTVKEPYNTRSRKIVDTSFSNFVGVSPISEKIRVSFSQ